MQGSAGRDGCGAAQGIEEEALRVRGMKERDAKGGELKEQELQPEGGDGMATGAPQTTDGVEAGVHPSEQLPGPRTRTRSWRRRLPGRAGPGARRTGPVDGTAGAVAGGV